LCFSSVFPPLPPRPLLYHDDQLQWLLRQVHYRYYHCCYCWSWSWSCSCPSCFDLVFRYHCHCHYHCHCCLSENAQHGVGVSPLPRCLGVVTPAWRAMLRLLHHPPYPFSHPCPCPCPYRPHVPPGGPGLRYLTHHRRSHFPCPPCRRLFRRFRLCRLVFFSLSHQ
jgi:hypothetical protein